jgi:hypothetical protein
MIHSTNQHVKTQRVHEAQLPYSDGILLRTADADQSYVLPLELMEV